MNYNVNNNEYYNDYTDNIYGYNNYYNGEENSNAYNFDNNEVFNFYGSTDIGKVSKFNEDLVSGFNLLNDTVMCLIVADGMGSVKGGQISSMVVVDEIKAYLSKFLIDDTVLSMKQTLYNSIYMTNRVVSNYMRINPDIYSSFTSTLTIVLVNRNKEMVLGHIGNSRLYMLREGEIYQITRDDTIARDLVDSGEITEEEYKVHPDRSRLNKYIGDPMMEPFVNSGTLQKEDLLLLCTNGLYEMLTDTDIKNIVYETGNSKDACEQLIESANRLGGVDNIGVMISYIVL